jgi:pectinesterase
MNYFKKVLIALVLIFNINLNVQSQVLAKALKDEFTITVAQDGSGDYTSIQQAINNSPAFPYRRVTITVKNGIYYEKVRIPECNPNISLIGESKEKTIITYDDYFSKINLGRNSTFYTYTLSVEGDNFIAQNLTIKNSAGQVGQAVALALNANKVLVSNCNILGNQDTFYATGYDNKLYLKDCYIEGTTDFIFGSATVLFENCSIHFKSNSYATAASTPQNTAFGFVFKNCKLTGGENVTEAYLGRPWRIYAKTVFINCEIGNHIKPEGWDNWSKPEAEKSAFYAEYKCTGLGFQPSKRVSWSYLLTKSEAKKYTIENILGTDFSKTIKESSLK